MVRRRHTPELEQEAHRSAEQGYEAETLTTVRCLEHGYPTLLARWHCHDEYELHLIVATRGKAYVGDYIGEFSPGHVVLTGPRLPHNWVSTEFPEGGVALRDLVMQFSDAPLRRAVGVIPELRDVQAMLERARFGIEFRGMAQVVREGYERIRAAHGLHRLGHFLELLGELAACKDHQLLSTAQMLGGEDGAALERFGRILEYLNEHCTEDFTHAQVAEAVGMSDTLLLRDFKRITGGGFNDFRTRLRVNRACRMLMETDRVVRDVCYEAGFNNLANFNRMFLKLKGMTPVEFRREARGRFGATAEDDRASA